jgi:thiamine-monophosphate kinase
MIYEFQLINFIKDKFNSDFIGDDAAVIPVNSSESIVISKDILIEDIHFIVSNNFSSIGEKSIISNASDIVAMGVEPKYFFLALGIPEKFSFAQIKKLLNGIYNISNLYKITLAGGDISKSDKLTISITILGFAQNDKIVYRSGAKINDDIWVTGALGDVEIGLRIIKEELKIENS